jgi:hypothetical protein
MPTVYDTTVVAYANGDLAGRKAGNVMDKRLCALEGFLEKKRVAWYNDRLLHEYQEKIKNAETTSLRRF